jgi:hypothetical protein
MKIKQWAFLTAGMYALSLVVLVLPLMVIAFSGSPLRRDIKQLKEHDLEPGDSIAIYKEPAYWGCVGVLTLLEGVLLLVPIQLSRNRPVKRRSWLALAVVAGLMMGLLIFAAVISIVSAVHLDRVDEAELYAACTLGFVGWFVWGVIFFTYAVHHQSTAFTRIIDKLIAGSIAELLVAVPCHVYVRQQDHCCASGVTFLGIATGLAVLLFAFGPGVFLLFVKRARRLQQAKAQATPGSRLRGFTRRAVLWAAGALLLALLPIALFFMPEFNTKEVWVVFRAGFVHAAAIACIYAWIALRKKEARGTWVLAGVAILAEMALLQAWLLARYPI